MMVVNMVERWGVFELSFRGKQDKNPFVDYEIKGYFKNEWEEIHTDGFYDGDGVYRIRFMPSFMGTYTYHVEGSFSDSIHEGTFISLLPKQGNRGPVRAAEQYHFSYSDGTPYYEIGTTCYAWIHQPLQMQEQTIETLKKRVFNKIRFCIFPKHYDYNLYEPFSYPYEGTPCGIEGLDKENFQEYLPSNPGNQWDFSRFNPEHFRLFEMRIAQLAELGIEADVILFHPYDRWGFSEMAEEADDRYVQYVIARLAAYKNVWWSLANEYDLCEKKTIDDWDRMGNLICEKDPYHRLRSIHNCRTIYDFTKPWITHCSIQRTEMYLSAVNTKMWRDQYGKPVVLDEVGYEGNINHPWGNITAEEMVRLFWTASVRGGYCGHGETYMNPKDQLWWSHGGVLHGESEPRLAFLHRILCETPGHGLEPALLKKCEEDCATAAHTGYRGTYYLYYSNNTRPGFKRFYLTPGRTYHVELIDTWNMTIEDMGIFEGVFTIPMPSRLYMAVRIVEEPLFKRLFFRHE